ncbi:hypothetical protein [Halorussus halobius]|uniref:hypothetical protein n=1 Tax=Halorussus halobius TaxID=1710537 RepID=UPI0010933407|nr:hypothetical protein [Halorussus halobius]
MSSRRRLKLVATAGAVAVALAVALLAADPSASEYELSVYDAYPTAFWLLLLGGLFAGQVVVFESADPGERGPSWKLGFGLMLAVNAVLLFVPAVRYDFYLRGDMLTFVGMIRDIGDLGAIPGTNYYPNVHLLAVAVSEVTGVAPARVVNYLPPVASLLYAVALYYLLTALFEDPAKPLFVLPFGALLLFEFENVLFTPSVYAFMLLPFVFYLLFRVYADEASDRFRLLFVVAVVSLVFYHPAVTVFFVGMLVLLKLAFVAGRRVQATNIRRGNTPLVTASIAFVLFFSWYYSFSSIIGSTLAVVYKVLGLSEGASTYGQLTSVFGRASPALSDVALVGVYTYGLIAAITGLTLALVAYLAYLSLRGRRRLDAVELFLAATFGTFLVGSVVAFFVDVTLGFTRFARYVRFAGSILIGAGFYALFGRLGGSAVERYLRPAAYVSFFVFAFLSVFLLYGSPLSNDSNLQLTEAEIEGGEWLFEHRNESLLVDQLGFDQYRMYTFDRSTADRGVNVRRAAPPPPTHFAYGNASLEDVPAEAALDRRYLVTSGPSRTKNQRFYPEYREFWRHTPEDFARLEDDPSVSHVYDDGELDAYVVRGVGSRANATTTDAAS